MKKYFVLLPLLLVTVFLTTFAHSTTRNDPRTEQAFSKVFAGASNVKWAREEGGYLRASLPGLTIGLLLILIQKLKW